MPIPIGRPIAIRNALLSNSVPMVLMAVTKRLTPDSQISCCLRLFQTVDSPSIVLRLFCSTDVVVMELLAKQRFRMQPIRYV